MWHLEHLCRESETLISGLEEQVSLPSLTKFHASDIIDKIRQAYQGRVMSFRAPLIFIKGRTFRESDYA